MAELGIWTWVAQEHIAEPVVERLIARIGLNLGLDGERLGSFISSSKNFLFGSNADLLKNLGNIRAWRNELVSQGNKLENQSGDCRQIDLFLRDERPSSSFGYFWLGAFDIFPYSQLIECYTYPENCAGLFSLFDPNQRVTGGGGSW